MIAVRTSEVCTTNNARRCAVSMRRRQMHGRMDEKVPVESSRARGISHSEVRTEHISPARHGAHWSPVHAQSRIRI